MNLTILTNAIPPKNRLLLKGARFCKRFLLRRRPLLDRFEGHPAVTRSVLTGLKKIGASFNYNPKKISEIAPTVFVLSDLSALRQAIELKKRGLIQTLFGGPNLLIDPSDEKELLSSSEIDGILVNSDWVRDFYVKEVPALCGKCKVWPSGINMDEWMPDKGAQKKKNVLIYDKLDDGRPIHEYKEFLRSQGWNVLLLRYGYYGKKQFLELLRRSEIAIFFSGSESQGLALQECWSADVPTIVWNRGWAYLKEKGKTIPASSAPYLNPKIGLFFSDLESFKKAFWDWEKNKLSFSPREAVRSQFSDEACARNLLKLIGEN